MPPTIALLPPDVADQIAAGEVVERPASVVKELVENALDAGASHVVVHVEEGGRQLVRIADDGHGMAAADARLALARHATSKIRAAHDLVGVRSFGFRGEALPAIASVSELVLETAAADGDGVRLRVQGGHPATEEPAARRRGTTVSVHRLFFNTPARRKFLRAARSEWRAIADACAAIALQRCDVHLTVYHDGAVKLDLPAVATLRERAAQLWGAADVARFLDVDDVQGPIHVRGLVERPADVGTRTRRLVLLVNGRHVRDGGIVRAAEAAYRSTLPSGVRPSLCLELTVPGDALDVNVHPAKAEVRFHDRWEVERAVEAAVRRALGGLAAAAGLGGPAAETWRTWVSPSGRGAADHATGGAALPDAAGEAPLALGDVLVRRDRALDDLRGAPPLPLAPTAADGAATADVAQRGETGGAAADGEHAAPAVAAPAVAAPAVAAPAVAAPIDADALVVPPLLQLRRTYLLYEHEDGVVLIDQHAAHERVLYERFLGTLTRGDVAVQRLLLPLTLHVSGAEMDAFERHAPQLAQVGFEVEPFGGQTLLVTAVPLPHPRFDAERCLRDTLAALAGDRHASDAARHERLAATIACKAAIKAGDALSPAEMRALYVDLARTTLPMHDVHGRAVVVRLSWAELDRRFGRGVG